MRRNLDQNLILALFCAAWLCANSASSSFAAGEPRENWMTVKTSDDSVFKGYFRGKDESLLTLIAEDGEEISLPVQEIVAVNGSVPSQFFKKFIPAISDSLFESRRVSVNKDRIQMDFNFLSSWIAVKLSNGFIFTATEEDRRWDGFRMTVTLESPPSIKQDLSYKTILKKVTDSGVRVLNESYSIVSGTQTLRTVEVARGNLAARAARQIRTVGGEACVLEIVLSHPAQERLSQPFPAALFDKVLSSIHFSAPAAPSAQPAAPAPKKP